jgi:AcrR family transcriptional regulator
MTTIASEASPASRGIATRLALIDAAEALIADEGFRTPSHRTIARLAGANAGLVNYHFGSKDLLFEAAIERRAERLQSAWRNALAAARCHPRCTVEDVLGAWWAPFGGVDYAHDREWGNYLCVVVRLEDASGGEAWYQRYFGSVDRTFREALADALPGLDAEDVAAGYRYARTLFGEALLYRCGKTGGSCRPQGFREDDVDRLLAFAAGGLRALRPAMSIAAD